MNLKMIAPLAVVSGAVAATLVLGTTGGGAPIALSKATPVSASSDELGAPSYLPSIATLADVVRDAAGGQIVREYALSGRANANTVTAQGLALNPKAVHPATVMTVYYIPGLQNPDIPVDPTYFDVAAVDINGARGTLSTPKSGLGAYRVDWVDAAGDYHVVLSERLKTPEGTSGLAAADLLAVARSVR